MNAVGAVNGPQARSEAAPPTYSDRVTSLAVVVGELYRKIGVFVGNKSLKDLGDLEDFLLTSCRDLRKEILALKKEANLTTFLECNKIVENVYHSVDKTDAEHMLLGCKSYITVCQILQTPHFREESH